jgi:hypothetical protein
VTILGGDDRLNRQTRRAVGNYSGVRLDVERESVARAKKIETLKQSKIKSRNLILVLDLDKRLAKKAGGN